MPLKQLETMRMLDDECSQARGATFRFAHAHVKECIADPETHWKDPITVMSALFEWDCQAAHQCYWNNRFVIAVMCNMCLFNKRTSAWGLVCNGQSGYFEWTTHSGYKVADVFRHLGIQDVNPPERQDSYCRAPKHILDQIADIFDLPTTTYGRKNRLTDDEKREREELNGLNEMFSLA